MLENIPFDPDSVTRQNDLVKVVVTRTLFGVDLFAWYIFKVETNDPALIAGTLMTPPFTVYGPYDTMEAADAAAVDIFVLYSS